MKIAIAVLSLLVAFASSSPLRSQELIKLNVASGPVDDTTPVLYAVKAGLFRRAGLDVQVTQLRSGAAIAAAVAGGSAQIGASSLMPLISANVHGVHFFILAPGTMYDTSIRNGLMVVQKNSPIHTAHDLNGQVIGTTSLSEVSAIATLAWIDQNGGDSRSVKMVEVSYPAMLPALVEGRIAAGALVSPTLEQQLESGQVRVLSNPKDAIAKHFLNSAWFTTADYATANPDIVARFARVMREASAYANAHHAETVDLIAAFTGLDPAVVGRSVRPIWGERLDPSDIQPIIDAAVKYKGIDRSFDAKELISPVASQAFGARRN